ncbi:probably inactive leucine-rich repeat receptor-like protein kinase At3g28040 [Salvia miltiorrhiza]|uniref:probably inactive leucine-rich repeat receptor-like protein kinase At3g28040 n=1 Tax=Salvia miltiorrhiza TaxID=226208 RepID=UPI0025AB8533|nr:probably inactive leucine-rich repeat receptor-like protein kinase At3g28040 [Salvia miltiorrhiza]
MKMKHHRYALLLLLSYLCLGGAGDVLQLNDDVLGLIVFKTAFHDPHQSLASWNEDDASPCAWRFVQCNAGNARVSELRLDGLGLSGKISRGLEKLQSLKLLSLSNNNLTGTITPDLALVPNLEHLNLSRNSLSGNLPPSLSTVQFLDLSHNALSGPLADNMFDDALSLRFLSLAGNSFEGPLPSSLSKCVTLNHLNLSSNRFSGSFSGGIWSLARLRTLDLSRNSLSGQIPTGMAAVHNLKELVLHGNQFSGFLPPDIGFCPHLSKIDFSYNFLTGTVPESLQKLNELTYLSLSNNFITGDFPQWIGEMSSLEHVDLSGNALTSSLPSSIGDLKSIKFLNLGYNKLFGAIPSSLGNCWTLCVLRLGGNALNGSIPNSLFDMKLEELDLSRNEVAGFLPPPSSKLYENLQVLDLSGNNLVGDIPAEMGLLSKLRYLNLSWNHLESRMPPELGYFQNLTVLDLRNNGLIGSIPGDICDSGSLAILQLDENSFAGPIPDQIGNCSSLYLLSLSHNTLSGNIPESVSLLSKLKILKLEENELSGEIPQQLGRLENLLIANISHNRLVGRLPAGGIFQTLDATSIEGNPGICSPLVKSPCVMNVPKPLVLDPYAYGNQPGALNRPDRSNPQRQRRTFLSVSAIVAISAAAFIAVGVLVISLLNASARRRIAFIDNALESMCSSSTRSGNLAAGKLVLFDSKSVADWHSNTDLDSILSKAAQIGEGVFGSVYKATTVAGEGTAVAIKRLLTANTLQYHEEFDREVRILGKARHPNLIPLRGYYWTPQLQLLVSDYAAQGSLQARLHEPGSEALTWPERFRIVVGTAKGLAHLHHSFRPPIIHYNLKPSNVLLDENLNPKISDFGLARLLTKLDRHVASNRFQSAVGYVAPELACQSLRVNEKCDVYGFGVMILEVVTRRRAVEYGEDNVVILSDHVRVALEQGNVLDCVDPTMGDYPEEEVLPLLKLALVCTSQIPSTRPSMAEVVQILQVIKTPLPNRMQPY